MIQTNSKTCQRVTKDSAAATLEAMLRTKAALVTAETGRVTIKMDVQPETARELARILKLGQASAARAARAPLRRPPARLPLGKCFSMLSLLAACAALIWAAL